MKAFVFQVFTCLLFMFSIGYQAHASCPPEKEKPRPLADLKAPEKKPVVKSKRINPKINPAYCNRGKTKASYAFMFFNPFFANLHFLNTRLATECDTVGA